MDGRQSDFRPTVGYRFQKLLPVPVGNQFTYTDGVNAENWYRENGPTARTARAVPAHPYSEIDVYAIGG
jgi:hypothetical protein